LETEYCVGTAGRGEDTAGAHKKCEIKKNFVGENLVRWGKKRERRERKEDLFWFRSSSKKKED